MCSLVHFILVFSSSLLVNLVFTLFYYLILNSLLPTSLYLINHLIKINLVTLVCCISYVHLALNLDFAYVALHVMLHHFLLRLLIHIQNHLNFHYCYYFHNIFLPCLLYFLYFLSENQNSYNKYFSSASTSWLSMSSWSFSLSNSIGLSLSCYLAILHKYITWYIYVIFTYTDVKVPKLFHNSSEIHFKKNVSNKVEGFFLLLFNGDLRFYPNYTFKVISRLFF